MDKAQKDRDQDRLRSILKVISVPHKARRARQGTRAAAGLVQVSQRCLVHACSQVSVGSTW